MFFLLFLSLALSQDTPNSWIQQAIASVNQRLRQELSSPGHLSKAAVVNNLAGTEELNLLTHHYDRLYPHANNNHLTSNSKTLPSAYQPVHTNLRPATSLLSVNSKIGIKKSPLEQGPSNGLEDSIALSIDQATERSSLLHDLELSKQDAFDLSVKIGQIKQNIYALINRLMQDKEQILAWIMNQKRTALTQIGAGITIIGNVKNMKPRLQKLIDDAEAKRTSYQKSLESIPANTSEAQQASLTLLLNYYIKQADQIINSTQSVIETNEKEANTTETWIHEARESLQKWLTEQETALVKRLHEGEAMVMEWNSNITSLQQLYRAELQKQLNTRSAIARLDMSTRLSHYATDLHQQTRLQTQIYDTHPGLRPDLTSPDLPSLDSLAYSISRPPGTNYNTFDGGDVTPAALSASTSPFNLNYNYNSYSSQDPRLGGSELPQMPLLPPVPRIPVV